MRIAVLILAFFLCFYPVNLLNCTASANDLELIPQKISLKLSGSPVPQFLLKALAYDEVARKIEENKAKNLYILKDQIQCINFLYPKETTIITVPVLTRKNGKKSIKQIYVVAKNKGLSKGSDDYLMISNDPEIVPREGVLFREELKDWKSARLLYYHSTEDKSFDLVTTIYNPTDWPIEVFASAGIGGPSNDGIYAGHVATLRFMNRMQYNAGRIIKIPPRSSYELVRQRLTPQTKTGTAIARLWLVSGHKAGIEIKAQKPGEKKADLAVIRPKWDNGRISYFVPSSIINIEKEFDSNDYRLNIRIGEEPVFVTPKRGFDIHLGNYGLLHRINLKLSNNKGNKPRNLSLYYTARGGVTRGVFLINGELYETGLLDTNGTRSEKIASIKLPPRSSKNLEILMMQQPGAYYPTTLSVHAN